MLERMIDFLANGELAPQFFVTAVVLLFCYLVSEQIDLSIFHAVTDGRF